MFQMKDSAPRSEHQIWADTGCTLACGVCKTATKLRKSCFFPKEKARDDFKYPNCFEMKSVLITERRGAYRFHGVAKVFVASAFICLETPACFSPRSCVEVKKVGVSAQSPGFVF